MTKPVEIPTLHMSVHKELVGRLRAQFVAGFEDAIASLRELGLDEAADALVARHFPQPVAAEDPL